MFTRVDRHVRFSLKKADEKKRNRDYQVILYEKLAHVTTFVTSRRDVTSRYIRFLSVSLFLGYS